MYAVFYTSAAARQLRRLPQAARPPIERAVADFAHNPRTAHTEKLEGAANAYRMRVGDYRVLYTIEDHIRRVVIYRLRHRREAYRR